MYAAPRLSDGGAARTKILWLEKECRYPQWHHPLWPEIKTRIKSHIHEMVTATQSYSAIQQLSHFWYNCKIERILYIKQIVGIPFVTGRYKQCKDNRLYKISHSTVHRYTDYWEYRTPRTTTSVVRLVWNDAPFVRPDIQRHGNHTLCLKATRLWLEARTLL